MIGSKASRFLSPGIVRTQVQAAALTQPSVPDGQVSTATCRKSCPAVTPRHRTPRGPGLLADAYYLPNKLRTVHESMPALSTLKSHEFIESMADSQ